MMQITSLLLVDDHESILHGLRGLLHHEPDIEVVGQAQSGEDAIRLADLLNPDIMVLDIHLHGIEGFEVVRQLRAVKSPVCFILFSVFSDEDYIEQAIELGVEAFLLKEDVEQLAQVIRRISSGERYFFSKELFKKHAPGAPLILVN